MKNSLGRFVPHGFIPYESDEAYLKLKRHTISKTLSKNKDKLVSSMSQLFDILNIKDGMCLSFHHHLRNGDGVLNMVLDEIKQRNLKNMVLAPSAIFPVHAPMVELIKSGHITKIYTNYVNGPVAEAISQGFLKDLLLMDTHGGRPRAIESGELKIDVAFIAVPTSNKDGHGHGISGPSACGVLGYPIPDLYYASKKVVITDHLASDINPKDIDGNYVDYVLKVDSIGDPKGIQSGTTKPTTDPIQLKTARQTVKLMDALGYIKEGLSFQTGAGGTSLAVAQGLKKIMEEKKIKGSFASGGITYLLVEMLEAKLFEKLYDVQCFDLNAVESYKKNNHHLFMSASTYGNPLEEHPIVNDLDVVILGATEVDLHFNVNVTTSSSGMLMGGSGGHADTAYGAKCTIITTNLMKSRLPIIKKEVKTITTPGSSIDCIVTERGIAINPKRTDLIEKLKDSKLHIVPIESLYAYAIKMTGNPEETKMTHKKVIGVCRYRDGSVIDTLYQV